MYIPKTLAASAVRNNYELGRERWVFYDMKSEKMNKTCNLISIGWRDRWERHTKRRFSLWFLDRVSKLLETIAKKTIGNDVSTSDEKISNDIRRPPADTWRVRKQESISQVVRWSTLLEGSLSIFNAIRECARRLLGRRVFWNEDTWNEWDTSVQLH